MGKLKHFLARLRGLPGGLQADKDDHSQALITAAGISFLLLLLKLIAFIPTGSLLVLSSVLDSLADTINSLINYFVHRASRKEADREHPFGHGGFEVMGSLVQGLVIAFLGFGLLQESLRKFFEPTLDTANWQFLPMAGVILFLSSLAGLGIQKLIDKHLKAMEVKHERSLAILADRAHYAGDALANLLAALGIFSIYLTEEKMWDSILGCLGAFVLMASGFPILKKCFHDIVHNEAPLDLQQSIVDMTLKVDSRIKAVHFLRSREFGPHLFVDFHIAVPPHLSLQEAHAIAHQVEAAIKHKMPRADILIHIDPESQADHPPWSPAYTLSSMASRSSEPKT